MFTKAICENYGILVFLGYPGIAAVKARATEPDVANFNLLR